VIIEVVHPAVCPISMLVLVLVLLLLVLLVAVVVAVVLLLLLLLLPPLHTVNGLLKVPLAQMQRGWLGTVLVACRRFDMVSALVATDGARFRRGPISSKAPCLLERFGGSTPRVSAVGASGISRAGGRVGVGGDAEGLLVVEPAWASHKVCGHVAVEVGHRESRACATRADGGEKRRRQWRKTARQKEKSTTNHHERDHLQRTTIATRTRRFASLGDNGQSPRAITREQWEGDFATRGGVRRCCVS
jgi:hypothetical protein